MLILVKHKINNEYFTIYRRDKDKFLRLKKFFEPEPFNFELIEDLKDIKKILEDRFTSKGRGEEYDSNNTSVTKIAYGLYPMDIDKERFLIKYLNSKVITPENERETQNILSRGTFCHLILQLWITDIESRKKDKPLIEKINILKGTKKPSKKLEKQIEDIIIKYIEKYIELAFIDDEIIRKVDNLEELKPELRNLALNALPKFIYKELINTDLVYSEIFMNVSNYIQGSIDLVGYRNNDFCICDYKTTSSLDKKTGKPKFKTNSQLEPYSRQLAIYYELLKRSNMNRIPDEDYPNFYIYQIHLIGNTYKKFEIPKDMVKNSTQKVNEIINWFWNTREGKIYNPPQKAEEELKYLTL